MQKADILAALRALCAQRPGFDPRNYATAAGYRADLRRAARDRRDAELLLAVVGGMPDLTAGTLVTAARQAFAGRVELAPTPEGGVRVHYTTGQYFPTEYRAAVVAVLVYALWEHWRDQYVARTGRYDGARDAIARDFRATFGAVATRRWRVNA